MHIQKAARGPRWKITTTIYDRKNCPNYSLQTPGTQSLIGLHHNRGHMQFDNCEALMMPLLKKACAQGCLRFLCKKDVGTLSFIVHTILLCVFGTPRQQTRQWQEAVIILRLRLDHEIEFPCGAINVQLAADDLSLSFRCHLKETALLGQQDTLSGKNGREIEYLTKLFKANLGHSKGERLPHGTQSLRLQAERRLCSGICAKMQPIGNDKVVVTDTDFVGQLRHVTHLH